MTYAIAFPSDVEISTKKLDSAETMIIINLQDSMEPGQHIDENGLRKLLGRARWEHFEKSTLPEFLAWGWMIPLPAGQKPNLVEIPTQTFTIKRRIVQIETFEVVAHNSEEAVEIVEGEDCPDATDFWESSCDVYEDGDEPDC